MKQSQRLQIDPAETIIGFNFNFMRALLTKARELQTSQQIYLPGENSALCTTTVLGAGILNHLSLQMGLSGDFTAHNLTNIEDVNATIEAAEEFLTIFKGRI